MNEFQGDYPFVVPGIVTKSIQVQGDTYHHVNNLTTLWRNKDMVLNGGLDIKPNKPGHELHLSVCLKHLDHEEFTYTIELVRNFK